MIRMTIAFLLLINFFATFVVAEKQPKFMGKELEFYSKHKTAKKGFTRPLGWGKGIYWAEKDRTANFFWFAYCNEDGWIQIVLDTRLAKDATIRIEDITDSHGKPWETNLEGSVTWIGTTNDWVTTNGHCRIIRGDTLKCDFKKGLRFILDEINKQSFISFEVRSYLDWPK